jgi:hypothetical protein
MVRVMNCFLLSDKTMVAKCKLFTHFSRMLCNFSSWAFSGAGPAEEDELAAELEDEAAGSKPAAATAAASGVSLPVLARNKGTVSRLNQPPCKPSTHKNSNIV